jgi:hypothetical protein
MNVWMYECMHIWMYACMNVCMHVWMYECMNVWMYECMHECMDVWMYAHMNVCMHTWLYHAIKEVDVDFQVVPNGSWTLPLAVMLQACLPIQPRDTSLPNLINFFGGNHLMLQQVCSLRLLRAKSSRRPSSSMGFGGSYRLSPLWHWFRMPNTPIFKLELIVSCVKRVDQWIVKQCQAAIYNEKNSMLHRIKTRQGSIILMCDVNLAEGVRSYVDLPLCRHLGSSFL